MISGSARQTENLLQWQDATKDALAPRKLLEPTSQPIPLRSPVHQPSIPNLPMARSLSALLTIVQSPVRILAVVLVVVFIAELAVMFALPHFPGKLGVFGQALVDAVLLTCLCAPALWWVIIGPLRRIAIQEHARSETIVANASEGIVTFDAQGQIHSANRATEELFGLSAAGLIGRSLPPLLDGLPKHYEQLPMTMKLQAKRQDGSTFPALVSVSQYTTESNPLWIAVIRDQTAAEQAERQRLVVARETEALRAQQMATLAQLATGVAHEIRNPLTSIKMLIQVNLAKLGDDGVPTDDLQIVEDEIRRMERSINSLLEFARPEQQELTTFRIADVVDRVFLLMEGRCKTQRVQCRKPEQKDVAIHADMSKIQQLLLNLCLNALDAMPAGGVLEIKVTQKSDSVCIDVCDTGPGIDDSMLDRLFTPFVTTKPQGVGLGLGICRQIAEAHGGTLIGGNGEKGGAQFCLELPLTSAEPSRQSVADNQDPAR